MINGSENKDDSTQITTITIFEMYLGGRALKVSKIVTLIKFLLCNGLNQAKWTYYLFMTYKEILH